jgi:hypothetical protein
MSPNKFLEIYPQLIEPKVGDRVKIIKLLSGFKCSVDTWFYCINDVGTIIKRSSNEWVYEIYFSKYTESFPVYREEFEII